MLGSSDLPIIGENRCWRRWVNKTEDLKLYLGNKAGDYDYTKRELSTKLIKKTSVPSTSHESLFRDKQKFHSAPKQRHRSLEQLAVCNVVTINNIICLMMYIFKHRAQHLVVRNNALPLLGNLPIIGDFPLPVCLLLYVRLKYGTSIRENLTESCAVSKPVLVV
jgi:hypothetical protein